MTSNRPRPLSDIVPRLAQGTFGKRHVLFGRMVAEWAQVAGAEIAARCVPLDLKFSGTKDKKGQAVLHLAVQPAFALELGYQKNLLIERLNVFFGYGAIKDVRFIQYSGITDNKSLPIATPRPATAEEERDIAGLVAGVEDGDLQIALKNLGKAIVSRRN